MSNQFCFNCDSFSVTCQDTLIKFQYGEDNDYVMLEAIVPLFNCNNCGLSWYSSRGEESKDQAVKNF